MQSSNTPIVKDLVLIGGGHSHVIVLKRFAMKPLPGVRITLICRDAHTPYSGMLPGYVAGHYNYDDVHIDLGALARFANARFFHSTVTGLDAEKGTIKCNNRPEVSYDILSINTGSTPNISSVSGAEGNVIPVKPINNFLSRWQTLKERVIKHDGQMRIAVVGAGAGGVETLLAINHHLIELRRTTGLTAGNIEFHLFSNTPEILPTHSASVRQFFTKRLKERGVLLHLGDPVTEVEAGVLRTANSGTINVDEILWVTAAGAPDWPRKAGLDVDEGGFINVLDTNRYR